MYCFVYEMSMFVVLYMQSRYPPDPGPVLERAIFSIPIVIPLKYQV